ncbi:DUF6624 domain-containing protein [Streptomyces sp. NPDC093801]|uniref:DUF6624 domain-containing protein n=1 Tax=Streptomyces sp. NPDC093801 TaxID=3155203 RepID=UPI00344F7FFC
MSHHLPAPGVPGSEAAAGGRVPSARERTRISGRLRRMARAERTAGEHALALPTAGNRRADLAKVRERHQAALRAIITAYGWPTVTVYGHEAATAAVVIARSCPDLSLLRVYRNLLLEAVFGQDCQLVHFAVVDDVYSVRTGLRQVYGTQIHPVTGRPFPVRDQAAVNGLRVACGLEPLPGMPTDSGLYLPASAQPLATLRSEGPC